MNEDRWRRKALLVLEELFEAAAVAFRLFARVYIVSLLILTFCKKKSITDGITYPYINQYIDKYSIPHVLGGLHSKM